MYNPGKKGFGDAPHYMGPAPTGVLTFCDSTPQHGITSFKRQLAACDQVVGSAKYYASESSSIWAQAMEDQSLASDTGSIGILSSRKSASISSSTIPQLCGHVHDFLESMPLEVQHPWTPEAPVTQKTFHRSHQRSANRLSSGSDISNETSSYFSCASSVTSTSTQQFHECNEWYRCVVDDHISSESLEPEGTVASRVRSDAPACDSDLFQPINILMESFESFGSIASSLKFRSLHQTNTQSHPRISDEQETVNGHASLRMDPSETNEPLGPSKRQADRPSGNSFGTVRLEELDTIPDSVSDLMTSSEDGEEEGIDLSYNAWMIRTGDDLSVGSGESNRSDNFLKPVNAENSELRLPTKVPSTNADVVQIQSPIAPGGCSTSEHNPLEMSKPISIPRVQATKSSASEDSLGLMERVVGMTLQSLKRQGSWTDISTLQSEKSDLDGYNFARFSSDAADWSESPLTWEFAEESQALHTPTFKALTSTNIQSASGTPEPVEAVAAVSAVRKRHSGEAQSIEEKYERAELQTQSRDPALTYLAQSNPTFRNRLSLEISSESDHPMSQDQIDGLQDVALVQNTESTRSFGFNQGCKGLSGGIALQVNDLYRIGSIRLTDSILKEFDWRLPFRKFASLSEPPGLNFMQSTKYRILAWFRKIFNPPSLLTRKNIDSVRRSLTMDGFSFSPDQCNPSQIVQSYKAAPSAGSDLCEDAGDECVTPAASVVEEEFGFRDAECLNQKLRSLPEFQGIDMRLWTSKMIGFATPAKYYAHMARELHGEGVSVFTILYRQLGVGHSLIQELRSELEEDGKELIVMMPPQRTLADEEWNSREKVNEWGTSVLSALLQCGINALFFDRGPAGFESVSEYYSYLSQKLRTEGVDIDCMIPQLEQRLGVQHPLMDALEKCVELNGDRCEWKNDVLHESNSASHTSFSTHETNHQEFSGPPGQSKEKKKARTRLADFVRHKLLRGPKHTRNYSADAEYFRPKGLSSDGWEGIVVDRKAEAKLSKTQNDDSLMQQKRHTFGFKGLSDRLRNRKGHKKNSQARSRGGSLAIEPTRMRNAMEMERGGERFTRGCVSMDPGTYGAPRHSNSECAGATADQVKRSMPGAANGESPQMNNANVNLAAYASHRDSPVAIKTNQASRARCRIGEKAKRHSLFASNLETFPL